MTKAKHGSIRRYELGCRCQPCKDTKNTYLKSTPSYKKLRTEASKTASRARFAKRRSERWNILAAMKDKPCVDCENKFPPECMDFDHVRGKKLFNVSLGLSQGYSFDTLATEIEKCDLVCANCHRIRTRHRARQ